MFFHIDETGNTGNNLFDNNQPQLSYGVLASLTNVDALGQALHATMLAKLGVPSLHASELGVGRLDSIARPLLALHEKMKFEFGLYVVEKPTYALVQLFEAVFDAGLNDAVPWSYYWTPLRFYVIHHLAQLVDEPLLKRAWELCIEKRIERRYPDVVSLLSDIRSRVVQSNFHPRMKEVMCDAFDFGIAHPDRLDFGFPDVRMVSPNAIGFQFVVADVARRVRKKRVRRALAVTLDHQQQFNAAQLQTHRNQELLARGHKKASSADRDFVLNHPLYRHLAREEVFGSDLNGTTPVIVRSERSIGLQIVDVYLWLLGRVMNGADLPVGLAVLANQIGRKTSVDGVSMEGLVRRWTDFESHLPKFEHLSREQLEAAQRAVERHREKVADLRDSDAERPPWEQDSRVAVRATQTR